MSSVNWQKQRRGEAKAKIRHDDKHERKEAKHTNPDIDVSRTGDNLEWKPSGFKGRYDYASKCARLDKRIAELDANPARKRRRKDRPELVSANVPCPAAVTDKDAWAKKVLSILVANTGGMPNFVSAVFHKDEVHEYLDAKTGEPRMSLEHLTYKFVPGYNGILDAKSMIDRDLMHRVNDEIELMTQREFGCKFMTGEKKKGGPVEELKCGSVQKLIEENERLEKFSEHLELIERTQSEREAQIDAEKADLQAKKKRFQRYYELGKAEAQRLEAEAQREHVEPLEPTQDVLETEYREKVHQIGY